MKRKIITIIIIFIISILLICTGIFLSLNNNNDKDKDKDKVNSEEIIGDYNISYYDSLDDAINYIKNIRYTDNVNIVNEDETYYYIEVNVNDITYKYTYSKIDNTLMEE